MSFIELPGLNNVREKTHAPEGSYGLIVENAKVNDKEGKHTLMVVLSFDGHQEEYENVFHHMSLPGSDDDADKRDFKLRMIRRFTSAFNVPIDDNGFNVEAFLGCAGTVRVGVQEYPEGSGRMSNTLILPKFTD